MARNKAAAEEAQRKKDEDRAERFRKVEENVALFGKPKLQKGKSKPLAANSFWSKYKKEPEVEKRSRSNSVVAEDEEKKDE